MSDSRPRIVGFACNWCCYAGADLAGTSRMKYPSNIRIIRVMCSGRLDPSFIIRAFKKGADGVFIGGCHPGDCHYQAGNYKFQKRYFLLRNMLQDMGIEPERLHLTWVSASEGQKFANEIGTFTRKIAEMGPLAGARAPLQPA
jgi:F420-non-reducing hydrogenase iron-sulfur subunit